MIIPSDLTNQPSDTWQVLDFEPEKEHDPENGLYRFKSARGGDTISVLKIVQDGTDRTAKYRVFDEGDARFDDSFPDRLDVYNSIVSVVGGSRSLFEPNGGDSIDVFRCNGEDVASVDLASEDAAPEDTPTPPVEDVPGLLPAGSSDEEGSEI